jgi:TRAP-type C4-dicarboxylate transport system permease large subunit
VKFIRSGIVTAKTIRYCWALILAEVAVLAMVIFLPDLAGWIPHRFLG